VHHGGGLPRRDPQQARYGVRRLVQEPGVNHRCGEIDVAGATAVGHRAAADGPALGARPAHALGARDLAADAALAVRLAEHDGAEDAAGHRGAGPPVDSGGFGHGSVGASADVLRAGECHGDGAYLIRSKHGCLLLCGQSVGCRSGRPPNYISTLSPRALSSSTSSQSDSGTSLGLGSSPRSRAEKAASRPRTSSDLMVSISLSVWAAP